MQIEIPKNCPCCDYPLTWVNDQLFCRNSGCSAQVNKKLEHFAKVLGIKGFGPKTIEKLQLADITEVFYLDQEQVAISLGSERMAEKLIQEINRAKYADLSTVLASFSIPLVGNTASKKISQVVTHINEINKETCQKAGLGEKVTNNLLEFLETEFPEIEPFLPFSFVSGIQTSASGSQETVCITGKLKTFKSKAEAAASLEAAGYKVVESVTKTTSYLVDEENKGSSKRIKADELGTNIITNLKDFLKETKHND